MVRRRGISKRRTTRGTRTNKCRTRYHQGGKRTRAYRMRGGNDGSTILKETRDDLNTIDFNKVKNLTFVDLCQDKEGFGTLGNRTEAYYGGVTTYQLLKEFGQGKQNITDLLNEICVDDKYRSIIHGKRRGKALAAMGTNVKPTIMKAIFEEFNTSPDVTETDKEAFFEQWQAWIKKAGATCETWKSDKRVQEISNGEGTAYWLYKDEGKTEPMKKDDCDIKVGKKLVPWLLLPIND